MILKCFVPVAPNFYPVRVPKYMFYSGGNLNQKSHYRVPFPLEAHISDAKRPDGTPDDWTWACSSPHSERANGFGIVAGN